MNIFAHGRGPTGGPGGQVGQGIPGSGQGGGGGVTVVGGQVPPVGGQQGPIQGGQGPIPVQLQSTGLQQTPGGSGVVVGGGSGGGGGSMVPGTIGSRVGDILQELNAEFENMEHDSNVYKMQRDDYERKLEAQLNETTIMQQTIHNLEQNYLQLKHTCQQYEEEIMRLRSQVQQLTNGGTPNGGTSVPLQPPSKKRTNEGDTSPYYNTPNQQQSQQYSMSSMGPKDQKNFLPLSSGQMGNGPPGRNPTAGMHSVPSMADNFESPNINTSSVNNTNMNASTSAPSSTSNPNSSLGMTNSTMNINNPNTNNMPTPLSSTQNPTSNNMNINQMGLNLGMPNSSSNPSSSGGSMVSAPIPNMPSMPNNSDIMNHMAQGITTPPVGEFLKVSPSLGGDMKSRKEGTDWVVVYNPTVKTNVNINLAHNLEHSSVVCCVKFSANGKYLATGCNKNAQIFDVESGERVSIFPEETGLSSPHLPSMSTGGNPNGVGGFSENKEDTYIRSVCFSPDGKFLVAGAEDKTVKVWDIKSRRIQHSFVGHDLDIYSLDYSPDGSYIVSGSGDGKVKIWNLESAMCMYTLTADEVGPVGITSVAVSPDNRFVAAGSLDSLVRVWDSSTGKLVETFEGHTDSVYSIAFSPDGKSLASGSLDKTLKLWEVNSGARNTRSRCISTLTGHRDYVLSVAFSPEGKWLISGSKDRSIQFWDPRSAVLHLMLQGHKNSVISVAVNPKAQIFATGSGDNRARIWKYDSSMRVIETE